MKIIADENIPIVTIETLLTLGHDVLSLHEASRKGLKDIQIWQLAHSERRLLITTDKGFARHRTEEHFGILIIRLKRPNLQRLHERILIALNQFSDADWRGLLVTIRDETKSIWKKKL